MKFNEYLYEEFKSLFIEKGFVDSKYFAHNGGLDFYKRSAESIHWIRLTFDINKKSFVQVNGLISFPSVNKVLEKFVEIKTDFIEETVVNYYLYQKKEEWAGIYKALGDVSLKSEVGVQYFKEEISEHVSSYILPFFDKIPDIQSVNDEVLNRVPQTEYSNYIPGQTNFKVLILMKLCKNLKYTEYKRWALDAYQKGATINPNRYEKDYDLLKLIIDFLDNEYLLEKD